MNRDLPNYVFGKPYDHFYLFTEFDVIFNTDYSEKLAQLFEATNAKRLFITLEVPEKYTPFVENRIELSSPSQLESFYLQTFRFDNQDVNLHMMNFCIADDSNMWQTYVSLEMETAIFACISQVQNSFIKIFKPYSEITLDNTYKTITDMFNNNESKIQFIQQLEKVYKFGNES